MAFLVLEKIVNGHKNFFMGHKKGITLLGVTIFYFGYLFLGGFIFCLIETPQEATEHQKLLKVKSNLLAEYPTMPENAVDKLLEDLIAAGVKGIVLHNDTTRWTNGNGFLFSMTLVTTIGFGHVSPGTQLGKVVCIIYTILGIPITLIIMAMHVHLLKNISNSYKANLFRRLGYQQPFCVRSLHFCSVMVFIIVGTFLLPAWVFYSLEPSWTYLDAVYFCFISLTTVGLGDFVPGIEANHPNIELYRFFTTLYLVAGVTVVMFMMGLVADYYHNCNKGFHILPVKITPEKVPIMCEDPPSYGTIVIPETSDETRILLS